MVSDINRDKNGRLIVGIERTLLFIKNSRFDDKILPACARGFMNADHLANVLHLVNQAQGPYWENIGARSSGTLPGPILRKYWTGNGAI